MERNDPKKSNEKIQLDLWSSLITEEDYASYDPDAAYQRFLRRIGKSKMTPPRMRAFFKVMKYAAAAALLVGACFASYILGKEPTASGDFSISVPYGAQTSLSLPDGTSITLNSGSTLSYAQDFGKRNRTVSLEGEGHFDVAHDGHRPFIVETKDVEVKVLGTVFNVKDYADDTQLSVSLYEGSVSLENRMRKQPTMVLSPNQSAILNKTDSLLCLKAESSDEPRSDWRAGWLHFDEIPLSDICLMLERKYKVNITFGNEGTKSIRFYGSFNADTHGITDIMDILASTGKIKYTYRDDNITITN